MFTLDPQLERDTLFITDLEFCRVLLMNNALFPWIVLVPRVEGAVEIVDLLPQDRPKLMDEICHASTAMQTVFKPLKLNVAALGNQVKQLHVHVVARTASDAAWPNPVWGRESKSYDNAAPLITQLKEWLWAS